MNSEILRPSGAQLYAYCAGAFKAQQGLPDPAQDMGPAERGIRIHAVLEAWLKTILSGGAPGDVEAVPETVADEALTANVILSRLWQLFQKHGKPIHHCTEAALTVSKDIGGVQLVMWRGQCDFWFIAEDWSLHVCDWKTGWGDVPDARINMQARVYLLGVAIGLTDDQLKRVLATGAAWSHIITPRGMTSCRYDAAGLEAAADEAADVWTTSNDPAAARTPGHWCANCRALNTANCPESKGMTAELIKLDAQGITPEGLARLLDLAKPVEEAIERARNAAKAILAENPDALPGWGLSPGRTMRSVPDTAKAIQVIEADLSREAVIGCCTLKLGALEEAYSAQYSVKPKAAKEMVQVRLAGLIEEKQAAASLKRIK